MSPARLRARLARHIARLARHMARQARHVATLGAAEKKGSGQFAFGKRVYCIISVVTTHQFFRLRFAKTESRDKIFNKIGDFIKNFIDPVVDRGLPPNQKNRWF